MIEGISDSQQALSAALVQQAAQARTPEEKQKIKDEFLALFYKEILKQMIKPSDLTGTDNNSMSSTVSADIFLDRMAMELVQSNNFGGDDIFPAGERTENIE